MERIKVESLAQAQTVINRMARRIGKSVTGVFSPVILHVSKELVEEDGKVGSVLFPCSGMVNKVALKIPNVTAKEPGNITLELETGKQKTTTLLTVTRELSEAVYKMEIPALSVLTIYATAGSTILASMLFIPDVGNYKVENYLIDNIERVANEGIRDTIDEGVSSGTA